MNFEGGFLVRENRIFDPPNSDNRQGKAARLGVHKNRKRKESTEEEEEGEGLV